MPRHAVTFAAAAVLACQPRRGGRGEGTDQDGRRISPGAVGLRQWDRQRPGLVSARVHRGSGWVAPPADLCRDGILRWVPRRRGTDHRQHLLVLAEAARRGARPWLVSLCATWPDWRRRAALSHQGLRIRAVLARGGSGDDYAENDAVRRRFFDAKGALRPAALARLRQDVTSLLLPSPARAWALNRASLTTMREQSFVSGRDTLTGAVHNVLATASAQEPTGVRKPIRSE